MSCSKSSVYSEHQHCVSASNADAKSLFIRISRVFRQLTIFQITTKQQPAKEIAKVNARRRVLEDHLGESPLSALVRISDRRNNAVIPASIFMGYILVFLVCHSPRLMLNIYELFTIRQAMECQSVGLDAFPLWPQVGSCQSLVALIS